jgi:hypothetical protein
VGRHASRTQGDSGAWCALLGGPSTSPLDGSAGASAFCWLGGVKVTRYFEAVRQRPDRAVIQEAWMRRAIDSPIRQVIQADGRIRRRCQVPEMNNRYLRVILLSDGETVHNAFCDRGFVPLRSGTLKIRTRC